MQTSVRLHFRRLVALAIPVTLAQLAGMFLMVVDLLMLGRVGVDALGAASLGRVWMLGTLVFGMGLLFGLDPIASQAWGAGDRRAMRQVLGSGLVMAGILSVPIGALWLVTGPILAFFGQDPGLAGTATVYVWTQIPGLPFFLGFITLKQYLQARGRVMPAMWITLAANLFNVVVNWVLIFGHFGFPPLGVMGAGIATSLTHLVLFVALFGWIRRGARMRLGALLRRGLRRTGLLSIFRFGYPVAFQLGLEMWTFQIATLWAGRLGDIPLAAHTVAITMASVTFMVPLGVSIAAATRVGNLIGAGEPRDAQRASWVAIGLGACIMMISALFFWLGRNVLPRAFTPDLEVIAAAALILPVAAAFQIFDGIQVVGGGILRGMGQTKPAAAFNLVGYYGLALPLAYWLAFPRGMGLPGIWWGLCLGLATVAVCVTLWIRSFGPDQSQRIELPS